MKKKKLMWTETEWVIFEKGFEEGFSIARRLYRPVSIVAYAEDGTKIKPKITKTKS